MSVEKGVSGEVKYAPTHWGGWEAWVTDPKSGTRFRLGWFPTKEEAQRYLEAALRK